MNKYIFNLPIKLYIIFFILSILNIPDYKIIMDNNSLDYYFSYSLCKFFYFEINYNCTNNIFIDNNFYQNIMNIYQNINLFISIKKAKIENIFLLIGIMPFLKNNSSIIYKINKKEIFKLFKNIFKYKKIKNKIIKLNEYDFQNFIKIFKDLINYKWELIPKNKILNNIRYIINNYYNESFLQIFDKSLNLNFKYYFQEKKQNLSLKDINYLMSKTYKYIIYFIFRKYRDL